MTVDRLTEYSPALCEAFNRLLPQLSAQLTSPDEGRIRQILAAENTALLAAMEQGRILGLLTLVWYDVPSGRKAWIEDVVVDTDARGKGVGQALVAAAQQWAVRVGADRVLLTSAAHRIAAHALYKTMNFKEAQTTVFVWKENAK